MTCMLLLAACDTVYQPLQWDGGYQDKQLAPNHFWIEYLGNTTTPFTWVQKSWHKRAQELCRSDYRTKNMKSITSEQSVKKPIIETPLHRTNPTLEGEVICV